MQKVKKVKKVKKVTRCRICYNKNFYTCLDFGKLPLPNALLKSPGQKEQKFKLACILCRDCGLLQLSHVVNPKLMFSEYAYIPSVSKVMMNNFRTLFYLAKDKLKLGSDSFVVDIGSNDGSLLGVFRQSGVRVLGVDPAHNLAKQATVKGIPSLVGMFSQKTAKRIEDRFGKVDLITATNVIAHIDNLSQVFKGVSVLLKEKGLFITEFPYLLDLINKNQFDTIYHEHLSYFSVKAWSRIVDSSGFRIADILRIPIHGGSLRIVHRKKSGKLVSNATVKYLIGLEQQSGLASSEVMEEFNQKILVLKDKLLQVLLQLKAEGKRIVGVGAPAKGNILTNVFNIGPEILDYVVDSTPYKQGMYTPGKHIPIYPEEKILQDKPDYALILAWNFANEIMRKHDGFKKRGGKFIIPIPSVKII